MQLGETFSFMSNKQFFFFFSFILLVIISIIIESVLYKIWYSLSHNACLHCLNVQNKAGVIYLLYINDFNNSQSHLVDDFTTKRNT